METAAFFLVMLVGFLSFCYAWRAYKVAMRAFITNELYCLLDEWRFYYVKNGFDLKDGVYSRIRNVLTGQLEFAMQIRFVDILRMVILVDKAKVDRAVADLEAPFLDCLPEISEKAKNIRSRSMFLLVTYIVLTSVGFVAGGLLLLPVHLLQRIRVRASTVIRSLFKPDMFEYLSTRKYC